MNTRLLYLSDETMHSFIFRVCLVNGDEHLADVTNSRAQWRSRLRLNAGVRKYFTHYTDHDYLVLMKNSWKVRKNPETFSDPTGYMSDIKNLLAKDVCRHREIANTLLKFCIFCIRESIIKNGFGYFKSTWHGESNYHCLTHNTVLTRLIPPHTTRPHELIKTILRGAYPVGCHSPLYTYKHTKEHHPPEFIPTTESNTLTDSNNDFIYIAECLKNEIKNFIRFCPEELPKMALITESFQKTSIKRPLNEKYLFKNNMLSKIINNFFTENFTPFIIFWNKNAVKTIVYGGVVNLTDISEFLYIYKNTKICSTCKSTECPLHRS